MQTAFTDAASRAAKVASLTFDERFALLVDAEHIARGIGQGARASARRVQLGA